MQTFLSEPTFEASAKALDRARLQKQLLECRQMLDAIVRTPLGGRQKVNGKFVFAANHPVTNMYRGHERLLFDYASACMHEMAERGIDFKKNWAHICSSMGYFTTADLSEADWMSGWKYQRLSWTHRASLYRKDPEYYADYMVDAITLDNHLELLVCCPHKHANYYYPAHEEI